MMWQVTDAGAALLLEALSMDRNMLLLDLSANQLTMKRYMRIFALCLLPFPPVALANTVDLQA